MAAPKSSFSRFSTLISGVIVAVLYSYLSRRAGSWYPLDVIGEGVWICLFPAAKALYPEYPQNGDEVEVKGLGGKVRILRDAYGVPTILGESEEDVWAAQGFMHAADRLWQLELNRRAMQGRLSEVLGEKALKADKFARVMDFYGKGCEDVKSHPEDFWAFRAFTKGVNAYFHHYVKKSKSKGGKLPGLPLELRLLGSPPVNDWTVEDSAGLARFYAFRMNRGRSREIIAEKLKKELGEDVAAELEPLKHPNVPYINPEAAFGPALHPVNASSATKHAGDEESRRKEQEMYKSLTDTFRNIGDVQPNAEWATSSWRFSKSSDPKTAASSSSSMGGMGLSNEAVDEIIDHAYPEAMPGGSNTWAVSGRLTKSGSAIFAGDPHLPSTQPGFWYPSLIRSDRSRLDRSVLHSVKSDPSNIDRKVKEGFQFVGTSVPGLPGFFGGYSGHVAFSATLSYADSEDIFRESLEEGLDGKTQYRYEGQLKKLQKKTVEILVKGEENPRKVTIRATHNGPLISDVFDEMLNITSNGAPPLSVQGNDQSPTARTAYAIRSTAVIAPLNPIVFTDLAKLSSWEDLRGLAENIHVTRLTLGWSDDRGNIGAFHTGHAPLRDAPSYMRDGTSKASQWKGLLPNCDLPHVLNPKQGYVIATNHHHSQRADAIIGKCAINGLRATAIERRIKKATTVGKGKIDLDEAQSIQKDLYTQAGCDYRDTAVDILGSKMCEGFVDFGVSKEDLDSLKNLLKEWNCEMQKNSTAATFYSVWKRFLVQRLLQPSLSREAAEYFMGRHLDPVMLPCNEYVTHDKLVALRLLSRPPFAASSREDSSSQLVKKAGGTKAVLCESFNEALIAAEKWGGRNWQSTWLWGEVNAYPVVHAFHSLPLLRPLFSLPAREAPGDEDTSQPAKMATRWLNATHRNFSLSHVGGGAFSPSFKMVIDLGDPMSGRWILPTGVSGNPLSRHYSDMRDVYERGDMLPMPWNISKSISEAQTQYALIPSAAA